MALGVQFDVVPTVLSATEGRFGIGGQVWLGIDHVRLRYIGAHLDVPKAIHGQDGFTAVETTVWAAVIDYTFGDHYDEWWVSTGFELWLNEVGLEDAVATRAEWQSVIWTVGGGYIWRFYDNFYLDPWIAVHVPLNNLEIAVGNRTFDVIPIQPEVSIKIGYFIDL